MTNIAAMPRAATRATTNDDVPLEPPTALPTVAPYQPTVGGWIGTGAGTVFGGLGGAGVGGVLGLAAGAKYGGNGYKMSTALAIGGALAGLVAGGIGTYDYNKNNYEKREHARIQAEHGTSTLQFARDMMTPFDHDTSGSIELENTTGLPSQDERVVIEERSRSRSTPRYDVWADEVRTHRETWTETRGRSAAAVWTAADTDPKDGVITDIELARMVAAFDVDRSGSLTTPEQEAFRESHPLIVDEWRR